MLIYKFLHFRIFLIKKFELYTGFHMARYKLIIYAHEQLLLQCAYTPCLCHKIQPKHEEHCALIDSTLLVLV